jgi:hypothetical protein
MKSTVQERVNQIAEWVRLTDAKLRQDGAVSGGCDVHKHSIGCRSVRDFAWP